MGNRWPAAACRGAQTTAERGEAATSTARPGAENDPLVLVVGLLLAVVLGGLYGFNRFREQAIATYFANNKPPPAQISAAEVKTEAVPRFATGIGSVDRRPPGHHQP